MNTTRIRTVHIQQNFELQYSFAIANSLAWEALLLSNQCQQLRCTRPACSLTKDAELACHLILRFPLQPLCLSIHVWPLENDR